MMSVLKFLLNIEEKKITLIMAFNLTNDRKKGEKIADPLKQFNRVSHGYSHYYEVKHLINQPSLMY